MTKKSFLNGTSFLFTPKADGKFDLTLSNGTHSLEMEFDKNLVPLSAVHKDNTVPVKPANPYRNPSTNTNGKKYEKDPEVYNNYCESVGAIEKQLKELGCPDPMGAVRVIARMLDIRPVSAPDHYNSILDAYRQNSTYIDAFNTSTTWYPSVSAAGAVIAIENNCTEDESKFLRRIADECKCLLDRKDPLQLCEDDPSWFHQFKDSTTDVHRPLGVKSYDSKKKVTDAIRDILLDALKFARIRNGVKPIKQRKFKI